MDINSELSLFVFDLVGCIGFGYPHGFKAMESGEHHPVLKQLILTIRIGVYMMLVPWFHVLTGILPGFGVIPKPQIDFREFVESVVNGLYAEPKGESCSTSIIGKLMAFEVDGTRLTKQQLTSDGVILTLAGADTTFSSLTHIAYRLARHPDVQAIVRREVLSSVACTSGPSDWSAIAKLPYLEAFINEVLRLHPPTPTSLPRRTPPEGLILDDGIYIPGDVDVVSPIYSLHRDPRYFIEPDSFVPERWLANHSTKTSGASFQPRPEMIQDKRAFMPFLRGPYRCAGTYFAYAEMKMWLANVVLKFEVQLPDFVDVGELDRRVNLEWRDYTMTQPVPIQLRFVQL
jgi:cytochrome P450